MRILLLVIPCLLAIAVPMFNTVEPTFIGIPFFYWWQMLLIPVSSGFIYAASRLGRR